MSKEITYYIEEHKSNNSKKINNKTFLGSYKDFRTINDLNEWDKCIIKNTGIFVSFNSDNYDSVLKWNKFVRNKKRHKDISNYVFKGFSFEEPLKEIKYIQNYCFTVRIYIKYDCPLDILNWLINSKLINENQAKIFSQYKCQSSQIIDLIHS